MSNDGTAANSLSGTTARPTGYGLTLTFVGAILLALAYYGIGVVEGARELGNAVPEPVYLFVFALLFVTDLLNSRQLGLYALGRAVAVTVLYGALFVLAVEGGVFLWENPAVVLDDYVGLTVLAASLVVAALCYVGYLTVITRETEPSDSGG